MVDYQDILSRLPLNADEDEVISDPSYILNDVRYPITYLRINDTEACAVVHATYSYSISVEGDVSDGDSKTYVVRVIVIKANAKLDNIFIPNSVCTIYGAENVFSFDRQTIYVEDDNPYFEYRGKNLFSKDGEDLIHGHLKDGDEPSLDGVRTIHALGWHHEQVVSCRIPASVNKIGRLVGKFSSVTFEGTIPEFSPDALDGTMIESITVLHLRTRIMPQVFVHLWTCLPLKAIEEGMIYFSHLMRPLWLCPRQKAILHSQGQTSNMTVTLYSSTHPGLPLSA